MNQSKGSWMTVAGLLVTGLFIVGLAIVASKPFQESWVQTDVAQDMAAEFGQEESAEPSDEADEASAEALEDRSSDVADAVPAEVADDVPSEPADEPPSEAADANGAGETVECCEPGDTTPPLELVKQVPPGGLHNPYDWKKLKEEHADDPDYLVKQFRLPGCNECHGGGGGGGFCPALSQGVWFWGNTDDVLFRLIAIGTQALEKQGFERIQWGTIKGPMPEMGHVIKTSDHLWRIIAFIRSINPPGTNPPEKVIPGRYTPPGEKPAE